MPTRQKLSEYTSKDSEELKLFFHPQGSYLAVMNKFREKKSDKYSVELFETKDMHANKIPHQ